MSADVPTTEPSALTAGDTWTWQIALADYPATDGWVLSYALVSSTAQIAISSTAAGDEHLVSVSAVTTAGYAPNDYSWQSYVTLGTDRRTVGSGALTVRPNLATATAGYDTRSVAAKTLASIETYLTTGQIQAADVQIDGRAIKYWPLLDLYKLRDQLKAEVANERAAESAAALGVDPRRYNIRLGVE